MMHKRPKTTALQSRRRMLRNAGITLGLPFLPSASFGQDLPENLTAPRRMLLISNNLGVLPKPFFPEETGRGYTLSPYLGRLAEFRDDFTVISGLSHPDVEGGHSTENCFLTGARGPTKSGFRNTISLDQLAAEHLGPVTRFSTLNLGVNLDRANRSLSWTRDGVLLPAEVSATRLFRKMFLGGDPDSVRKQLRRLDERASILDTLMDDAKRFQSRLGKDDRYRLDQYLTSVREIETRLHATRNWEISKKPGTSAAEPEDITDRTRFFDQFQLMLSIAGLALESDSTRIVTLMVDAFATPVFQLHPDEKTTDGYHNLSHHGQSESKVRQLEDADNQQMSMLGELLRNLAGVQEAETTLLDQTMVLFGSNMGNSNTHTNTNLPILLAGGGLNHGRHLAFRSDRNQPLCNLFVTMLQQLGIDANSFGSSTGSIGELRS